MKKSHVKQRSHSPLRCLHLVQRQRPLGRIAVHISYSFHFTLLTSMCLIWFHNDISSPSLEPTKSPTGSPSSSPTVHPFRGYEWVGSGPGGECEDSNGELYSWVEFTNTVSDIGSAENCAHRCEELVTAEQVGIGYWANIYCRCYFDGDAPEDSAGADGFTQNPGRGPVAGRTSAENGENWHCYRRIVSTFVPTWSLLFEVFVSLECWHCGSNIKANIVTFFCK